MVPGPLAKKKLKEKSQQKLNILKKKRNSAQPSPQKRIRRKGQGVWKGTYKVLL